MPNLAEIHSVVWAQNPNKQTDRQTSFIYIYFYLFPQTLTVLAGVSTGTMAPFEYTSIPLAPAGLGRISQNLHYYNDVLIFSEIYIYKFINFCILHFYIFPFFHFYIAMLKN